LNFGAPAWPNVKLISGEERQVLDYRRPIRHPGSKKRDIALNKRQSRHPTDGSSVINFIGLNVIGLNTIRFS
jgi:hypothetical protein